jgi:hypothetical protein
MLPDRNHIGIVKLSALDRLAIHCRAVRAFQVFEKVHRLHPHDLGMTARDRMVVDRQIVLRLAADAEAVRGEIDGPRGLAVQLHQKFRRVGEGVTHHACS